MSSADPWILSWVASQDIPETSGDDLRERLQTAVKHGDLAAVQTLLQQETGKFLPPTGVTDLGLGTGSASQQAGRHDNTKAHSSGSSNWSKRPSGYSTTSSTTSSIYRPNPRASVHRSTGSWESHEQQFPLHLSVKNGNVDTIRTLASAGFELDLADSRGMTAVHLAVQHANLEALVVLEELGADLELQNADGDVALHMAASMSDLAVLSKLCFMKLSHFDVLNAQGLAPIHVVVRAGHASGPEALRTLKQLGADLDCCSSSGSTALHYCAKQGSNDSCESCSILGRIWRSWTEMHRQCYM